MAQEKIWPPQQIKPEDLRSECQACGGFGKVWNGTQRDARHITSNVVGQVGCKDCAGTGRVKPRKVYS